MSVRRKPRRDFYKWMWNMERLQRIRVQRRMWKLYDENRKMGGKVWKDIEAAYDVSAAGRTEMKYHQQQDGEWMQPKPDYKMACCDCGLVHRVEFRVVKGRVQFRAWRDNRATGGRRRKFPAIIARYYKVA